MNAYQYTDLALTFNEAGNTALALYMTAITSYLVIAYSVGKKLTRFQVSVASALFLFFAVAFSYSAVTSFISSTKFLQQAAVVAGFKMISQTGNHIFISVVALSMIAGILAAFAFMYRVRKSTQ